MKTGDTGRRLNLNLAGVRFEIDSVNSEHMGARLARYEGCPENAGASPDSKSGTLISANLAPAIFLQMTPEDIRKEKDLTIQSWQKHGIEISDIHDSYYEFTALLEKILPILIDHQIIYMHGSAICVNGQGFLFTAPSGTGKSTHARLWRERYGEEIVMINDDKPLIRLINNEIFICGSPWNGKHNLGNQIAAPLRGIVRLRRGNINEIRDLSKAEAFKELYLQTYRFKKKEKMQTVMSLLARIIEQVPCYALSCNMDPEAAEVARAGIDKGWTAEKRQQNGE